MKKYLSLAASALLLAACSEKPGYEITGTVSNADLNGNYVYLYEYGNPDVLPFDSALVENNTFKFKGTQNESLITIIQFSPDVVQAERGIATPFKTTFTLENGKLTIYLDTLSSVTGTPANDAEKAMKDSLKPFFDEMGKLGDEIRSEDKTVAAAAEKKYDEISDKITKAICNYILAHMDQKMSARYLYDNRYNLSEEQQNEILSKADSTFKAQPNIDKMVSHLEVLKNVAVGKKFTDFEMADPKGEVHNLSEYVGNGKVVLIDFWASWCPPCRRENPNVVKAFQDYKDKNFTIIGISLDNNKDKWLKAIADDNLTWTHVSDLKYWDSEIPALYGVRGIPANVLLDPDGVIIAKNITGEELHNTLKDVIK